MKKLLLSLLILIACNKTQQSSETIESSTEKTDIQAELASIEKTRAGFQLAIKEKGTLI